MGDLIIHQERLVTVHDGVVYLLARNVRDEYVLRCKDLLLRSQAFEVSPWLLVNESLLDLRHIGVFGLCC